MYKVSVILPTYNCAGYLGDSLGSLTIQSMHDFEIIVIDDASTDNTEEIVAQYREVFGPRITYLKLKERTGRGGVRNFGLQLAKGKYITFLDADDVYCPEKIETQSHYLDEHPEVGGVSCLFYLVDQSLANPKVSRGLGGNLNLLFGSAYYKFEEGIPMIMVRREIFDQVGLFDQQIVRGQDTDMVIRIARISHIGFIDHPLYIYRMHDANSFSSTGIKERMYSNILLYKKLLHFESASNKLATQHYIFHCLERYIYNVRERMYLYSVYAWFRYLIDFNCSLPLSKWAVLGIKVLVGYRFTQFAKRLIHGHFSCI